MSEPAEPKTSTPPPVGGLRHYLTVTRGPWYSFVFALPVLLAYEALIWLFGGRNIVNGADAVMSRLLQPIMLVFGSSRDQVLAVLLVIGGICCLVSHRRRYAGRDDGHLRGKYFLAMLAESCVYGLFFGYAVSLVMASLLPHGLLQVGGAQGGVLFNLTMALGAGIYEELFFRVIIMGGLALAILRLAKWSPAAAWVVAALLSSFIFSAFHYVGNLGDTFTVQSFMFRFISGLLLASLYGLRGFGVAVWTHALYDVLVMVLKGG